ncbi:cupin domain-containing protein [Aequorivita capsosiphonis]|uniref:cupin domain-containing protein n=1 Tax=Aequorivita capsosiphonis TaxID=487317 RepID=UPI000411F72B|nr:cupin [Aequorivita capsosiphonis]
MESPNKPEMSPLSKGETFKTLNITAKAGMEMPLYHSTLEAVIVVLKGESVLKMPDGNHKLSKNATFIIPAMVEHSLKINEDFHAIAIMENSSAIEFKR